MDIDSLPSRLDEFSEYPVSIDPRKGTPISRFPVELLARIFYYLSLISPYKVKKSCGGERRDWLAATHVSREWRAIAIGDARIWASNITMGLGSEGLVKAIKRARTCPLSVSLGPFRSDGEKIHPRTIFERYSELLRNHIANVASLELEVPDSSVDLGFLTGLGRLLTDITLTCEGALLQDEGPLRYLPVFLPDDTFKSPHPLLHTVILRDVLAPWNALALQSSIAHLEITNTISMTPDDSNSRQVREIPVMFAALARMQALEVLILDSPIPEGYSLEATIMIALPRLSIFELTGHEDCLDVLACLSIPTTCHFRCHFVHCPRLNQFDKMRAFIQRTWAGGLPAMHGTLGRFDNIATIRLSQRLECSRTILEEVRPSAIIEIGVWGVYRANPYMFSELERLLPLADLRSLCWNGLWPTVDWDLMLSKRRRLEELHPHGFVARSLVLYLSDHPDCDISQALPSLKIVDLGNLDKEHVPERDSIESDREERSARDVPFELCDRLWRVFERQFNRNVPTIKASVTSKSGHIEEYMAPKASPGAQGHIPGGEEYVGKDS